jgi:hypothetical protein
MIFTGFVGIENLVRCSFLFFFSLFHPQQALPIITKKMMLLLLRSSLSRKTQIAIVLGVIHQVSHKNKK